MTEQMPYETAIEDKPKNLYIRVETENFDDLTASIIASSVAAVFNLLRLNINNKKFCKTRIKVEKAENAVTMVVEQFCLAITMFGHLHLTGKKVVEKNKPYRAIYEIRLLREDLSGETG